MVEKSKGGVCDYVKGMGVVGGKVGKEERKKEPRHKRVSSIPGLATTARSRFRS